MLSNITDFKTTENCSINKIIENSIINENVLEEIVIEKASTKKKKGRKPKIKIELKINKVIKKKIIKLKNKIFNIIKIDNVEYFYDIEFNILSDKNYEPVGFKYENKIILYSEITNLNNQIKQDNIEINNIKMYFLSRK